MRPKRTGNAIKLLLKSAIAFLFLVAASLVEAQSLQTICSFDSINGARPSGLTLGNDGNFYGTTFGGGSSSNGTVFQVTTNGTLTTLLSFNESNGKYSGPLTLGSDGDFYGTSWYGGTTNSSFSFGMGTVFKVTTNGTLTKLASFSFSNGALPTALALGNDGIFYGMTGNGGITSSRYLGGMGTLFKVTTNGTLTTLVSLSGSNGALPYAALTLGNDGNFYGTTVVGGITNSNDQSGMGTVFKVTTNGTLTTLIAFNGNNGKIPSAGLLLGNDGSFYGTTKQGGSALYGTVFQVTTNGTLTTLVSFAKTNGANPLDALTVGDDGNLYGTTADGGITNSNYTSGMGTVFRLLMPLITAQPKSQTNYAGATVTALVSATDPNPISFQWQKNGTNLIDGGSISGATTRALTLANISDSDAATYSVIVSNSHRSVTSSNMVLTVSDLPFIAAQPQSQTLVSGSDVAFNATAYGAPPFVFQWYFNGTPVGSPATGTNVSSYALTNLGTNQAGKYSVEVVNGYGSVASSNATLTVVVPPIITTQPANRTNNAGTTATFLVIATSASPLSYQWQKNGTNLASGGKVSGVTNSTLTITNVSDNDAAIYSVTLANLAGSTTSSNATLTVITPPSITAQPLGQRIMLGSSASFSVSVSGTPPFSYRWRFIGTNLLNATNAAYTIQTAGATNTGNYSVVVTNLAGSVTSSNALLTVIVPPTLELQLWAGYPLLNLNGMLSSNFVVQYGTNMAGTNWMDLLSLTNLSASPYLILLKNLQLLFRTFFDWGRGQADQTQLRARQQLPAHRFCRL